eukprot:766910-Hanusia_phi.AAC.3
MQWERLKGGGEGGQGWKRRRKWRCWCINSVSGRRHPCRGRTELGRHAAGSRTGEEESWRRKEWRNLRDKCCRGGSREEMLQGARGSRVNITVQRGKQVGCEEEGKILRQKRSLGE